MWIKSRVSLGSIFSEFVCYCSTQLSTLLVFHETGLIIIITDICMILWKFNDSLSGRRRERERDWVCWGRLKLYTTISVFQRVSNEYYIYEEKLFMKSFQWLNWIHFCKNDPARETMKRYVWSKTSWFHFLILLFAVYVKNLLKLIERLRILLVCTLNLIEFDYI